MEPNFAALSEYGPGADGYPLDRPLEREFIKEDAKPKRGKKE